MAARFVAWVLTHRLRLVRALCDCAHLLLRSTVPYIFCTFYRRRRRPERLSSIILTLCKIEHVLATSTDSSALTLT